MDLYEYTIENNKIFDKYQNDQRELDDKLLVPDTLDNYKHNLKVKKRQLELAKYYRDKERAEKLKMDINYYIAKIKNEENHVYNTLFSNETEVNYTEKDMHDYNTLLFANSTNSKTQGSSRIDILFNNNTTDFSDLK